MNQTYMTTLKFGRYADSYLRMNGDFPSLPVTTAVYAGRFNEFSSTPFLLNWGALLPSWVLLFYEHNAKLRILQIPAEKYIEVMPLNRARTNRWSNAGEKLLAI
jgi:hypothetical protein